MNWELGQLLCMLGTFMRILHLRKNLKKLFDAGKSQTEEYQVVKAEMLKDRAILAGSRLEAVKKSLSKLLEYAARFNILLGLENRYHFLDIPTLDEMGVLLDLAGPDQLGFVYDVGHAQVMERLGFFQHEEWLKRFAPRIIGTHLHDVIGVGDHYVPGLGEVDFKRVGSYLPQEAFRTCEIKPTSTVEQIRAGLAFLVDQGCIGLLSGSH